MVYTKHLIVHSVKHLRAAVSYSEKAAKTSVEGEGEDNHFDHVFPYVMNDDKTWNRRLVSGYKISDVFHADDEFIWTKQVAAMSKGNKINFDPNSSKGIFDIKKLDEKNAVLAHHLIQSFSPDDDLSPEEIHEIGRKTVLELTGGYHEFVIATHIDKEHLHNHIIFNSTNMVTGNAFRWQKGTKKIFEQISDKHASKAGAKIIEKSPKNSHKKYTTWQTESIYKSQIKQRLDFLLEFSSDINDFKEKAAALQLEVNFSGKWATYRLLDQPQIKNTRGRSLSKSNPEKYNLSNIKERLKENTVKVNVDEVLERYDEKIDIVKQDFDYQVTIENWQVDHKTEKGYYLNVDFGVANHGQIFIGAYKIDQLENGDYQVYLKKKDFFHFMNQKDSTRSRYIDGETLVRQLSLYNGTTPLKKEPIISTINEIVDAINFLAEHGVTEGSQLKHMEANLYDALDEAQIKLDKIDEKILELTQVAKYLIAKTSEDPDEVQEAKKALENMNVNSDLKYRDIQQELSSEKLGRKILKNKFDQTVGEINQFNEIKAAKSEEIKEKSERKFL